MEAAIRGLKIQPGGEIEVAVPRRPSPLDANVVADSSNVGMTSPAVICPTTDIDVLITDDGISKDAVKAFEKFEVRVVIA